MDHINSKCMAWSITTVAVAYAIYLRYRTAKCQRSKRINESVDLANAKVVHSYDIEDLDKKAVFCRCWLSSKFPYCDGAHKKHNESTGDNVGPVIVQQK